ncbi:MAG TPA: transcription-repair coupling factor [Candidatus Krumholzibacteria bacterium]|nr:transcription-repair coupling factor [Candidatus Krumholzibacteria bacterium]HPD72317.1 transcription-repair coupling factor [Candidatus Krumholzibacteria bacterium]HRY40751.1 transcription-repair coupling factor [Candidatus Krumholzibacteria bacterium]
MKLLDVLAQQRGDEFVAELAGRLDAPLRESTAGRPPLCHGLQASAPAVLAAAWFRTRRATALCVVPTRDGALQLADDLEAWLGQDEVVYLPQPEVLVYDRKSPDPAIVGDLLLGLDRLRGPQPVLAVTSLYAARQRVIAPQTLTRSILRLEPGQALDVEAFGAELVRRGYRPAGMVARPGDFARRGGLIDIYAPGDLPLRVELFDDAIVSLRTFDPESQRGDQKRLSRALVYPVSHLLRGDEAQLACLGRLEDERTRGNLDEDEYWDLEARIEEGRPDDGLESYLPWFGPTARLLDYLPDGSPVIWFEPVKLGVQMELLDEELPRLRETRLKRDPVLPAQSELICEAADLGDARLRHLWVAEAWIRGDESGRWLGRDPDPLIDFGTTRPNLKGGDVDRLRRYIADEEALGATVLLLCDNRGQADRLADLLDEHPLGPPAQRPLVGHLTGGFVWSERRLTVVTDHEFFERYRRQGRVRHKGSGIVKDRASLRPGEYVAHLEYGIGRYRGLTRITVEGAERECLEIEYADQGKVYVPVENIDQVERYTSDKDAAPPLAKLGSGVWLKVTKKARKAIRAMAADLLELYAAREAMPGYAFPPDGTLQRGLEDSFLYEPTPDQLTTIVEVKRDMERPRPMDRLVCGDVGFGKTEVAMRAAFKAVMAGRQVAVLCPTTLLAHQHGETFAERFRDFPVSVAALSRFQTPAQAREITRRARDGTLDILIGTHRLLSRDVRFKSLGLLVVDEEQRFGVRHKERLKELKRSVDVMTLSATPIPRTLYLALMGARDMSLINTPPRDRLPIHTELCMYSDEVMTEAILRELHRGGQVFFVHNRVQTIEHMAARLQQLLPSVRVGLAHGQMPEHQLETIMRRFLDHEFDVLVTTTIIESGLDMPRVNTLVVDRADRFGLAQLYQLRGRVGRSNQRAFAYLMTPPGEQLTPEARRRLAALEEFQALGSGYHIAMRDLEIRGAGNLLGEEQSGHMEAIGFDLYCRLLEETVAELRDGRGVAPVAVKVDLRVPAFLPDEYVGDPQLKMDLYRRLARLRSPAQAESLGDEFRDRYGPLPVPVANLLAVHRIRCLASRNGVEEVRAGRRGLDLFFAGGHEPTPAIIRGLMATSLQGLQFKAVDQFSMHVPAARDQHLAAATNVLEQLEALRLREPVPDRS